MAGDIRQVEHYSVSIPDKVGEAARVLRALRDARVNLIAFWGYQYRAGRGQLEFIPENGAAFVAAAKQAELKLSKKRTALYFHGEDRPGAVADVLEKLAAAHINLGAVQAVCGGAGRYGAVLFLPPASARKAASILGRGLAHLTAPARSSVRVKSANLCANKACSREAHKLCSECSRYFCGIHVLKCRQCQLMVCVLCKFDHDLHSPLHEVGTPNA